MTLSTALINTLGVATWYLFGIAYMSLSWNYWPKLESLRGMWTPGDTLHLLRTHPHFRAYHHLPTSMQVTGIIWGYLIFLTLWPVSLYFDAKRKFYTKDDRTPTP